MGTASSSRTGRRGCSDTQQRLSISFHSGDPAHARGRAVAAAGCSRRCAAGGAAIRCHARGARGAARPWRAVHQRHRHRCQASAGRGRGGLVGRSGSRTRHGRRVRSGACAARRTALVPAGAAAPRAAPWRQRVVVGRGEMVARAPRAPGAGSRRACRGHRRAAAGAVGSRVS